MINHKGWQRVLRISIPYFFIVGIFQIVGFLIIDIDYDNINLNINLEKKTILSFFTSIGTFLTIYIFMKYVDKVTFINLGFSVKNKRYIDLLFGFIIGFFILFFGFSFLLIFKQISFVESNFNLKKIVFSVILFTIVAFTEETLFRGYILKNLIVSFNKYIALIVSSLLFALAHGANPNISWLSFFDLFLAGIFLGISYIFTKNLWFPIALHFSWNLFQTFFGFNVSGQDMYSIIEFKIAENNLLNGGNFGFEGSILSIVFQIIFIVIIWSYYRKQEKINSII